jgi:mycothiol system anti-sigma-R factor
VTEFPPTSGHDEASADAAPQIKAECAELIAMVWEFIDGECNPEVREKLRKHLDECPPCEHLHELEERLKTLIGTKCRGERAPEGFRERLRLEISRTTIIRR